MSKNKESEQIMNEEIDEKAHFDFTNSYIKYYNKFRKRNPLRQSVDKAKYMAWVDVSNKHGMEQANLLKDKYMKEEVEQLDEIGYSAPLSSLRKNSKTDSGYMKLDGGGYGYNSSNIDSRINRRVGIDRDIKWDDESYKAQNQQKNQISRIKRKHNVNDENIKKLGITKSPKFSLKESNMSDESTELYLHGDNTEHLYRNSKVPVMKNLEKKFKKGTYDHEKAKKLWGYHADRVAQSYHKEYGSKDQPWHKMFSTAHRKEAASHWANEHYDEMKLGNFHEGVDYDDNFEILDEASWSNKSHWAKIALDDIHDGEKPGDFHALSSSQLDTLKSYKKDFKYRAPKNRNGSELRYFHNHLVRLSKGNKTMNENIENIITNSIDQKPTEVANITNREMTQRILDNLDIIKDHIASTIFDIHDIDNSIENSKK